MNTLSGRTESGNVLMNMSVSDHCDVLTRVAAEKRFARKEESRMTRDYREKTIQGIIFDVTRPVQVPKTCDVTVRMTNDKIGQSLSLQAFNVMIEIPLESVTEIIKVSERREEEE